MDNFDVWLLRLVGMESKNHKIEEMVGMRNNHPLLTEGNKCPLQLHKQSLLNHQVVNTTIDLETLRHLSKQEVIGPIADGPPPIFVELPQDTNTTDDGMSHINNILSV